MSSTDILLRADYRGDPVTVTLAINDEIEFLPGPVGAAEDMLELWSFVAIRIGLAVEIHALGWRLLIANGLRRPSWRSI